MIDVDMGENQTAQMIDSKIDFQWCAVLFPLEDSTVNQQAAASMQTKFMAGTGYVVTGAVVDEPISCHWYVSCHRYESCIWHVSSLLLWQ
jgi:hypothetical protein